MFMESNWDWLVIFTPIVTAALIMVIYEVASGKE
jgi:hypothetical protein